MTRTVLIPSSLTRETENMRMATLKLGYIARAAAIFNIDRLCIFPDLPGDYTLKIETYTEEQHGRLPNHEVSLNYF